jgi:hypothetical protein
MLALSILTLAADAAGRAAAGTAPALPGTPASSRRENIRRLVLFALAQNPAASVEPESAHFVQRGTDCPRFFSMAQFSEYDARYG